MLLLLIVMVSICSRGSQRCNATYTADMICRRSAGFVAGQSARTTGNRIPGGKAATLRRQQNIPHGLAQVIRFRYCLAGIAVHPI